MDLYNRKYLAYELIREATGRDFSALSNAGANMRALRVKCIYDLERALSVMNWQTHKQNLYIGCAKLKEIPNFTFNPKDRSKETSVWYTKEFDKLVYESDLFIDLDSDGDINKALEDLKSIKEIFDEHKVPYQIIASGSRGFHIVIDGRYMPIQKIERGAVYPHKTFNERLKDILKLETMDLANNSLTNHLRKLPYSLVYPKDKENFEEKDMNIALPLSDIQIEHYRHEMIKRDNVLSSMKLMRRGNLERFPELSLEEKKKNVINLLKSFFCEV